MREQKCAGYRRIRQGSRACKGNMAERSAYEIEAQRSPDRESDPQVDSILHVLNGHRADRLPNNANFCFQIHRGRVNAYHA